MVTNQDFYRSAPLTVLTQEFAKRSERNARYSLRAYAKSLGISPSLLSLILSGKRPISRKVWGTLKRLGLIAEPESIEKGSFNQISLDTFSVISDWYHYAILNLLETPSRLVNEKTIAERLGISRAESGMALLRLARLGLIAKENKKWARRSEPLKVENEISSAASRKYHKQVLEKAIESLENDPMELRDFSAMTMAIDPKLVPMARKRIQEFRRRLTQELELKGNRSEVYHLTVQFYPVSKSREKK